jgi:uncharacterized phosphosugar-binding protein
MNLEGCSMVHAEGVFEALSKSIVEVKESQLHTIRTVAHLLADKIQHDGVIHIFGTGHSKAFAMELSNRAGGLVPMHAMSIDDLMRFGKRTVDDINDPTLERDANVALELLECYDIRDTDAAILVSNSGRNGSMVEMAIQLKHRGLPVVCVTSLAHTTQVTSRHPSGKRLFEVADYVIDNCSPFGDAALHDDRLATKVCSLSSITGAVIAQVLTAEMTKCLLESGFPVPVFMSANVDGADSHNEAVRKKYEGRLA